MPLAVNLVPTRFPTDRHGLFSAGLHALGYQVQSDWCGGTAAPPAPPAGSLLVTWNLHKPAVRAAAAAFASAGCAVIVCEEAYTRRMLDRAARPVPQHFAMGLGGHNGSGRWPEGGAERWDRLGIVLAPWRPATGPGQEGAHLLVCAARGMGSLEMAEPRGWASSIGKRLAQRTARPVRLRAHPGKGYAGRPLEADLAGAWAVVVWGSNCASHALVAGIPAFFEGPHIAAEGAAERGLDNLDRPRRPDRLPAFRRLAWGQWTPEEIRSGRAFDALLKLHERSTS